MTLEQFAKEYGFSLEFVRVLRTKEVTLKGKTNKKIEETWSCTLGSPYLAQNLYYEREPTASDRNSGGMFFCSIGKSRGEVRKQFVERIRGFTVLYGDNREQSVKIPEDLQ